MSIQQIIKEALEKSPLGVKAALQEELRVRVSEAISAKMNEMNLDEEIELDEEFGDYSSKKTSEKKSTSAHPDGKPIHHILHKGEVVGTIEPYSAYREKRRPGSRIVSSRTNVTKYSVHFHADKGPTKSADMPLYHKLGHANVQSALKSAADVHSDWLKKSALKEDAEQIDEISTELKKRYVEKGGQDVVDRFTGRGKYEKPRNPENFTKTGRPKKSVLNSPAAVKYREKLDNRRDIVNKVSQEVHGKKRFGEEVEQIEEALKIGSKVRIHAPGKDYHGKVGYVGEIRKRTYGTMAPSYTVDYREPGEDYNRSISLSREKIKLHKEEVELDEAAGTVKDGYYVTNQKDGNITHDKPFQDSRYAISHANKGEDKTGYVHRVHKVKNGKIDKQWEYNGGHMDGGWEHFSDFKGDDARSHMRNIPKHFLHGND